MDNAKGPGPLPGDRSQAEQLRRMLRVNQAGEFGAAQIYAGQLAVLGQHPKAAVIEEMAAQEAEHLDYFNRQLTERGVRPTALTPIWRAAGFLLGAGTALMGPRAAMACTVAVEEEIDDHYRRQLEDLETMPEESALAEKISRFRDDEIAHRDTALAHEAEATPGYKGMRRAIRRGTRLAIRLSKSI